MIYRTIVIDDAPKAKKMAKDIEKNANEMVQAGWELVTFSVTPSAKAILLFRMPQDDTQAGTPQEEAAETGGEAK